MQQCKLKNLINQNSVRKKSIIQLYNQFWSKFDGKVIKPPYKHCAQIGKSEWSLLAKPF